MPIGVDGKVKKLLSIKIKKSDVHKGWASLFSNKIERKSGMEHFNLVVTDDEVREFSFETGCFHDVVVNPVVIPAAGFPEQDTVVFEAVFVQPSLSNLAVRFGAGSEEGDDMAFLIPLVANFQGIGVRRHNGHTFRLFIGHIVADGPVNINEEILLVIGQEGADVLPFFIESLHQARLFIVLHSN